MKHLLFIFSLSIFILSSGCGGRNNEVQNHNNAAQNVVLAEKADSTTVATNNLEISSKKIAENSAKSVKTAKVNREVKDVHQSTHTISQLAKSLGRNNSHYNEKEDYDCILTVPQQAKCPGGEAVWREFLKRNLNSNLPADNGAPVGKYIVVVSFIVNKEGHISEVTAENDPGYGLAEEAVRVIKRSHRWEPAEQNGHPVMNRQRQQIVFEVRNENSLIEDNDVQK